MKNINAAVIVASFLMTIMSCNKSESPSENPVANNNSLPGNLIISGDPSSATGAKWTYTETGNVEYNLEGILYKPSGTGPFPSVIINHGTGGSALSYSNGIAKQMVKWGFVCIATNYTHAAATVPCGKPGSCDESMGEWGASNSNLLRAMKCRQILKSFPYADSTKLVSFGHSRGAFLTTYIAGNYPNSFRAFAHTAGGVNTGAEPSATTASRITKPYLMQHGDADSVVPLQRDIALRDVLTTNSVINSLITYPGYSHPQISMDSLMLARTRAWFELYTR